jgi:tetratricopeptide (TPR) repeat protein
LNSLRRPRRAAPPARRRRPSTSATGRRTKPCACATSRARTLFDEDFSAYPEVEDARAVTLDDFAAVAAELHLAAQNDIFRLEAEVAIREAAPRLDARPAALPPSPRCAARWAGGPTTPRPTARSASTCCARTGSRSGRPRPRAAVEHRPGSAEFWHFLGVVLRKTGALEEAIAAQERALELDPALEGAARERDQMRARLDAPPLARRA